MRTEEEEETFTCQWTYPQNSAGMADVVHGTTQLQQRPSTNLLLLLLSFLFVPLRCRSMRRCHHIAAAKTQQLRRFKRAQLSGTMALALACTGIGACSCLP